MKVRGEREKEERERAERVEREKEEERRRERRIEYLRFARRNLIPEEKTGLDVDSTKKTTTTLITLRLPPHPKPYKRRFPSNTPLEVLYLWADTLTLSEDLPRAGDPEDPPTDVGGGGYKHEFGFRLATSYPRKVVELGEGDGTVGGSEVLRVGAGVVVLERMTTEGGSGSGAGKGGDEEEEEEESEDDDGEGGSGSGGVEVSD